MPRWKQRALLAATVGVLSVVVACGGVDVDDTISTQAPVQTTAAPPTTAPPPTTVTVPPPTTIACPQGIVDLAIGEVTASPSGVVNEWLVSVSVQVSNGTSAPIYIGPISAVVGNRGEDVSVTGLTDRLAPGQSVSQQGTALVPADSQPGATGLEAEPSWAEKQPLRDCAPPATSGPML